jgi:CRISPR-associated protein Cas5t
MLTVYVQAPFAVFRNFSAGSFRSGADFITPSAALGLLLNLAGIEMRREDPRAVMTLIQPDLPRFRLALGALAFPEQHTLLQQLHNYPVGNARKEHAPLTRGNKYNIVPVRRSLLSHLRAYLCVDQAPELEARIAEGLAHGQPGNYGLPFLGDNNFLPDKLDAVSERQPAYWYLPFQADTPAGIRPGITRLTLAIDREDMSRTRSSLFAPQTEATREIPAEAWLEMGG